MEQAGCKPEHQAFWSRPCGIIVIVVYLFLFVYFPLSVSQSRRDGDRLGPSSTDFGISRLKPVSFQSW